jgi:TyrR family helix-turn-helix protein
VSPLRDRKEDVPALLHYFLNKYNKKYETSKSFGAIAIKRILDYVWPGNVRELENMVERFVVTGDSDMVEQPTDGTVGSRFYLEEIQFNQNYKDIVNEYETALLNKAFEQYGSTRKMSEALGLGQSTIVKKMERFGIAGVNK